MPGSNSALSAWATIGASTPSTSRPTSIGRASAAISRASASGSSDSALTGSPPRCATRPTSRWSQSNQRAKDRDAGSLARRLARSPVLDRGDEIGEVAVGPRLDIARPHVLAELGHAGPPLVAVHLDGGGDGLPHGARVRGVGQ